MTNLEKESLFTEPGNSMYADLRYYRFQRERLRDKPEFQNIFNLTRVTKLTRWLGEDSVNGTLNELLDKFPELARLQGDSAYRFFDDVVVFLLHEKVDSNQSEGVNNMWRDLARQVASTHSDFWIRDDRPENEQLYIEDIYSRVKTKARFFKHLENYRQTADKARIDAVANDNDLITIEETNMDSPQAFSLGFRLPGLDSPEVTTEVQGQGKVEIYEDSPPEWIGVRQSPENRGVVYEFLLTIGRQLHKNIDEEFLVLESHRLQHFIEMKVPREKLEQALEEIMTVSASPLDEKILGPARRWLRKYTRLEEAAINEVMEALKAKLAAELTEELVDLEAQEKRGKVRGLLASRKELIGYLKAATAPLLESVVRQYPPRKAYLKFKGVSKQVKLAMKEWK